MHSSVYFMYRTHCNWTKTHGQLGRNLWIHAAITGAHWEK